MSGSDIFSNVMKTIKSNAPEILTALGVTGLVTTSYLTAKSAVQAAKIIEDAEGISGASNNPKQRLKDHIQLTWKVWLPPAISGAVTITAIIASQKASSRRTAVAVAAYSLTEKTFSEYRDKVIDQIGDTKERKIADEIAQDKVNALPPCSKEILIISSGEVLCCELYTMRYFKSDMETLRRAMNDVNQMAISMRYVELDEFYDLVGLSHTSNSDLMGWDSSRTMELVFSGTLRPDTNEPCMAFDYNYVKPLKDD